MIPPGPRSLHPLGHYRAFATDRLALFDRCVREHGDVVHLRYGPLRFVYVFGPDAAKEVLVDRHAAYDKWTPGYKLTKVVLGEGLLTSEGDLWRRQRRLAQPAFHRERIRAFCADIQDEAESLAASWRARHGETVDVLEEMMGLTLRIVGRTVLGADLRFAVGRVNEVLPRLLEAVNHRLLHPLTPPLAVPTRANRDFTRMVRALDDLVYDVIRRRRAEGVRDGQRDLISLFMAARDEVTGEAMSDRQLRDEVLTMLLAGHETTAVALTWAFYELHRNPAVAAALRDEVRALGRAPTEADLPKLVYTRMVVDETLRLYPPALSFSRRSLVDQTLGGFDVPKGWNVVVVPFTMHRNPRVWRDPAVFDPERFRPGREEQAKRKHAYLPFGAGPRVCIGSQLALTEATLTLAALLRETAPVLARGAEVELSPRLTLRPKGGLPMRLEPAPP